MRNLVFLSVLRKAYTLFLLSLLLVALTSCGSIFGSGAEEPTPTPTHVAVPTFTATAVIAPPPTTPAPANTPSTSAPTEVALVATPTTAEAASVAPTATITPSTDALLTVTGDSINIRSGPDITFEAIGTAAKGETFTLLAVSAQKDWWQVCCVNGQQGWIFGQLATVTNADKVAVADEIPTPIQPTPLPVAVQPTAAPESSAPTATPVPSDPSLGDFNPNAQYQIVHFKVLGKDENNGGIRDSRAQHMIFITVLDQNGNGVDGAVVENLVGDKSQIVMGSKGPGKAEVTMYYESFKLHVLSDPSGPVTSQVSNQMGLAFPHLPDIVGRLGGLDYEYSVCPTIDVKCGWPIQGIHYSYEITFQKVK
ncbi:MAG: SH3 domain-containing protein [Caldilineaceae bacterium]